MTSRRDPAANAYAIKPLDWEKFTPAVQRIDQFFMPTARLPRPPDTRC
jgi:hypothetical protein